MQDAVFQAKLQSVMTDNKFDRVIPKRRTGKLDTRNLWRASVGAVNVFKQKQERKGKEYSVVLTVDESGSMMHDGYATPEYRYKFDAAVDVACYMARHLEKAGISFAVIGFNCTVITHKALDQKFVETDFRQAARRNYDSCVEGTSWHNAHGNHDHDAIELGMKMLSPEKHGKILMHLSDGKPACDYGSNAECRYDQDKHRPERIRAIMHANPEVKAIGVGILEWQHLDRMFGTMLPIKSLSEFKEGLIKTLEREIKRG